MECEVCWRMLGLSRKTAVCCIKAAALVGKLWSQYVWQKHVPGRSQCCWRTLEMTAAPAIHSWTHTEKVFCWPGDWLLFLLALKEALNMLMECSDLRLYPDSWNNTYMSNQYGLPLSETNNMWGIKVRISIWEPAKSISVKVGHWKLQCLLEATMRYLNLGSVTKVWKHFVPPPKQILCITPEAFWGLHGTKRYSSVQKSWEVLTVYYIFLWWGSVHLEQQ